MHGSKVPVYKSKKLMDFQAFFNVMLRDFGVRGVKVQEVVSLDEEVLASLP